MPWSNQTGGGGWKGGGTGGGGPWGQRPQNPRPGGGNGGPGGSGGGNSPDLEDILRRGQDRLRGAFGGRGGGGGAGGSGGAAGAGGIAILVVIGLVVLWLFQSIYTVQPDEVAVETVFGKPKEQLSEPGLHFMFWPVERVDSVQVVENQISLGGGANNSSGLMLSGDQNIVDVEFSVLYEIDNPQNFLYQVQDPEAMLQQVAESAMREVVGRRPVQDVFRDDRAGIAEEVRQIVQTTMNDYGAGLRINGISIEDASPPPQVADAFDEVQRAEQDEDRFVEEANRYRNNQLGEARGQAAQIREDAAAYENRVVQVAEGEAARFTSVREAYELAPEITRKRIFLDTMEDVLQNSNKMILENGAGGANGVVPYLPLNELNRQAGQNRTTSGPNASSENSATGAQDGRSNAGGSNRSRNPGDASSGNVSVFEDRGSIQ